MSFKSICAKIYAQFVVYNTKKWASKPIETQERVFRNLIKNGTKTAFGKAHSFEKIITYTDFVNNVQVRDYESLKPFITRVIAGEKNVLWPKKPIYFAKTSGTTSGIKYIPITKESMPTHINAARNAILHYINETKNASCVDGKMIFLQGSPILEQKNGISIGRLSGIVAHFVPKYLQKNRLPSWQTNCIEDWETKVDAIVCETFNQDMRIISGIPAWVQMYFEKLKVKTNQPISKLFKNFNLFIYGGVNYEPYRAQFEKLIGKKVDSIELFPASEGFFAYQNLQNEKGMLLLLNSGIFYEFIKTNDYENKNPRRYTISEVELNVNYVMIISTNAGLWAYDIGDTVMFVNLNPFKIVVSGRVKHYLSAFGEHVIAKEVETAIQETLNNSNISVVEFTVAPQINPITGLPYHEWFIEFENIPDDMIDFAKKLDLAMCKQNIYYHDLIAGKVLQPLKVKIVSKDGFKNYMKKIGKLGGQNKIPRLSNDRKIVAFLQ